MEKTRYVVDLHVHTDLSNDGRSTIAKQAEAAAARGLDAIVITDHNACALDAPILQCGVWLFPGCEISTNSGHILGLFLEKKPDLAALRKNGLPTASDAVTVLRECGAVTALAHPYTRKNARPDAPVDLIESANSRVYFKNPQANKQAEILAVALGLPQVGGSDAHCSREVGNAYTSINTPDCSMSALRKAILEGACEPVLKKNTPRRFKGYSQFRQARRGKNPIRIIIGIVYIAYCILLDILS